MSVPVTCPDNVKRVGSRPMFTRLAGFVLVLLALAFTTSLARAEGLAIKGQVKGTDGKPLAGAEIRAQRADGKGPILTTITDSKGEYALRKLELAPYAITTVIDKKPK